MAWFKVDDKLHDHRKARAVRRSHPTKKRDSAPFGLWVLAGSWAGLNGTAGFVPLEVLEEWDDDADVLAERLVAAGLWWRTEVDGEQGFGFHDWRDMNPDATAPQTTREASESGSIGNHVRWHAMKGQVAPGCQYCTPDDRGDSPPDSPPMSPPESDEPSPPDSDSSRSGIAPVPTRPDRSCASTDVERDFAEWYESYPRKRGRGQALKAYKLARKKTDHQDLMDAIRSQARSLTARGAEYVPYPATWLNGERWADQPDNAHQLPIQSADEGADWMRGGA